MDKDRKYKYIRSYASTFIEFPDSPFFLRHATNINYAGKVYTVIRGIEYAAEPGIVVFDQVLFLSYALFMLLGCFWYTRFWSLLGDIDNYYDKENPNHVLSTSIGSVWITLGASIYYLIFAILFGISYVQPGSQSVSLSFSIWNLFCFIIFMLAVPFKRSV
jgi:hypothetical protein